MTRRKASVMSHLQGEIIEGGELHTCFGPQGSSGTGPPTSLFKAHEQKEKTCELSVWISRGQILFEQPNCLLRWDELHCG